MIRSTNDRRARKPKKQRQFIEPRGALSPANWYTAKGLNRAIGLGEELLATMRASGTVKSYQMGTRLLYRGSDIVQWIEAQAK